MDYTVIKGFERSKLYAEFAWNRFQKKGGVFLLIGVLVWAGWMGQLIAATAHVPAVITTNIYHLN